MLTKEEEVARSAVWHLRGTLAGVVCDAFRMSDLRFKPERALRVDFRLDDGDACLMLWAPMNYVGVFECRRNGRSRDYTPWVCTGYHDSGWANVVDKFISDRAYAIHHTSLGGMRIVDIDRDHQRDMRTMIDESLAPTKEADPC